MSIFKEEMPTVEHGAVLLPKVRDFIARKKNLLIDGKWVAAASGETFVTSDPATEEAICTVAKGGAEDVDRAVKAARRAFESGAWPQMKPNERQRLLFRIGDMILANAREFGQLEALDNGMSASRAAAIDVVWAADFWHYYAGWATKIEGRTVPVSMSWLPDTHWHAYTLREPIGVCAAITPWNVPLIMTAIKLPVALACGNTVVLKPAEQTPLSALYLGELLQEAGLPPGVVNIVTGYGDVGAALVAHPDVDKVSFTGSTEVGRKIVQASAGNLKKVSLELGGKSPNIIYADADLDAAVPGCAYAWAFNSGQACIAGTRMFVEDKIFDEFTSRVAEFASAMKFGPGLHEKTEQGPLVSREQFDRVSSFVTEASANGAKLLCGGKRIGNRGFFFAPTIVTNVCEEMRIVREEVFGPVVVAMPFKREEEFTSLVKSANNTAYGLASGIWTRDISRAHLLARKLKAGSVWINTYNAFDTALSFGGYKQSGWGREFGAEAIDLYTQTKAVNVQL